MSTQSKPVQRNSGLSEVAIDSATSKDLEAIYTIEQTSFHGDRLTRRALRYLLDRGHATRLVARIAGQAIGYAVTLYRRGTSMARLYTLAVLPEFRGQGVATQLLERCEADAREAGCVTMRLEVRADNQAAMQLYREHGYVQFRIKDDYYEDHERALCLEKRLRFPVPVHRLDLVYYPQTTEFTCGPAALMMALRFLQPAFEFSQQIELQLWRESTTIFMTSGHGGCGPHGLALAAYRRGYEVAAWISHNGPMFVESVRDKQKKQVIALVQQSFEDEISHTAIAMHHAVPDLARIKRVIDQGGVPLALISSYRIDRSKSPHWVVVSGYDDHFIYIHDPYWDRDQTFDVLSDRTYMPIPEESFWSMARFGTNRVSAFLFICRPV